MLKALELLGKAGGRKIAVLSDMLELGHMSHELHGMIGKQISRNKSVDIVLAYGSNSKVIIENIDEPQIEKLFFSAREELTGRLLELVREGDTILIKASHGMKLDCTAAELLKAR
jgi:UDP-N-acetylmuramoyl-tripeptide--D-alanyl-D-alanine ligase